MKKKNDREFKYLMVSIKYTYHQGNQELDEC